MTQIAYIDLAKLVAEAGFPGGGPQATAIAVISAESGRDPAATNAAGNTPPSVDRGLWQINDYWHPEVTDAQAFDPVLATKEALRISNGGTSFAPWSAYNNGSYKQYLDAARVALDARARLLALEQTVRNRDATVSSLAAQRDQLKLQQDLLTASLQVARAQVADLQRQLDAAHGDDAELAKRLEQALADVQMFRALAESASADLARAKEAMRGLHEAEFRGVFG